MDMIQTARMPSHEWIQDRLLQDSNVTEISTSSPSNSFDPADGTSTTTDNDSILSDKEGMVSFGIVFLAAFAVVLLFVGWRSFKYWKLQRERYMLQVQSNRADAVLGDMQMVPNDEYDDDDPELL